MSAGRTSFTDKVVAPRTCVVCTQPYTPRYQEQETCGGRCARVHGGRQHKGQLPPQFAKKIQARREARREAIRQTLGARFGELSAREIEIFTFVYRIAYDRGYAKGLAHQRRKAAA